MLYKVEFVLWKLKILWNPITFVSRYWNLVLAITIFSFALYFQLAVLWAVYLVIYLIQSWWQSRAHKNYMQK